MREAGWDAAVKDEIETVRASLSRAFAAGEIDRPSYGVYGPKNVPHAQPGDRDGDLSPNLPDDSTDNGEITSATVQSR